MNKAEIARQLGISRAYVTMLFKGERAPSRKLRNKIHKLTNRSQSDLSSLLYTQEARGSSPLLPTILYNRGNQ